MTETQLLEAILPVAKLYRWKTAHFRPAINRRGHWSTPLQGDAVGWPDLVLVRDRTLFRELKQDGKYPTAAQKLWLDSLVASGHDAKVWRPADWVSGLILRELTEER